MAADTAWRVTGFVLRDAEKRRSVLNGGGVIAMADGMKEAIFLRYLRSFIFPDRDIGCTLIHEDNVSAIHLACNPATTPNSKHIDIRHHFIRESVERGEPKVVHVR